MPFNIGDIEISIGMAFTEKDTPFNGKHYWFSKWNLKFSKGFSFGVFGFGVWVMKSK